MRADKLYYRPESMLRIFVSNLSGIFRKRSKADITAQPVDVPNIWDENTKERREAGLLSVCIHVLVVAVFLAMGGFTFKTVTTLSATDAVELLDSLSMMKPPVKSGGGGGGGRREKTPASKGILPKSSNRQLTPPTPNIVNMNPILAVEPTIIVPQISQLGRVDYSKLGDPLGIPGPPSSGPGTGGGIGSGAGGGVGSGKGPGVGSGEGGGFGGGVYHVGNGVTPPIVIYRVEPQYPEDARKSKHMGIVLFSAIVRKDGSIEVVKLLRGLGLGLDESAMEALKQWRFRPATRNGVAVDVILQVEVKFSLL